MTISITPNKKKRNNLFKYAIIVLCFAFMQSGFSQNSPTSLDVSNSTKQGKVTSLKYICVHVLQLEKTLKLYREILGFKLDDAEVYHGPGLEGMLVMKLKANDLTLHLSVTAPEFMNTIGPVGNTNHNHFMLQVDNIVSIGDALKKEGYALENENYAKDKYTFFVGPNGEIIGLSAWD